jgi:hypothetical protein
MENNYLKISDIDKGSYFLGLQSFRMIAKGLTRERWKTVEKPANSNGAPVADNHNAMTTNSWFLKNSAAVYGDSSGLPLSSISIARIYLKKEGTL